MMEGGSGGAQVQGSRQGRRGRRSDHGGGGENSTMSSQQWAEGDCPIRRCAEGEGMMVKMKCVSIGERRRR